MIYFTFALRPYDINAPLQAFNIKAWFSNCAAVARSTGSFFNANPKKSKKQADQRLGCLGMGGGEVAIKNKAFRGGKSNMGGSPSANSNAMMPNDQMSTDWSYLICKLQIYGIHTLQREQLRAPNLNNMYY